LTAGRCRDHRRELQDEDLSGKTVTNIIGLLHKAMARPSVIELRATGDPGS